MIDAINLDMLRNTVRLQIYQKLLSSSKGTFSKPILILHQQYYMSRLREKTISTDENYVTTSQKEDMMSYNM